MTERRKGGESVLVVDGGGRGHALVDAYSDSDHVSRIIAVPGNDMMSINRGNTPVQTYPQLKTTSVREIVEIAQDQKVSLVDVAQDNAVEAGVVDALQKAGINVVGPTSSAGMIESDKAWAREFGERHELPQPFFRICTSPKEGIDFVTSQEDQSWFVKAAGLAEGKGALPAENTEEAIKRIEEMSRFGTAGKVFSVERWLRNEDGSTGEEFSVFALSDGEKYKVLGSAQDHKRSHNFDLGENSGGMGCVTPPRLVTPDLMRQVESNILEKTIRGMYSEGRPYKGVLYLGGMAIQEGGRLDPYIIEFNARWGDPEAEVIVPGLIGDFFEMSMAVAAGNIANIDTRTDLSVRVAVAGASKGYPGNYSEVKGKQIFGLNAVQELPHVQLFGAGIKKVEGNHYVNGGRLFYIVGEGKTVIDARQRAYEAMAMVSVEGNNLHFRTDIGWRDVERLREMQK